MYESRHSNTKLPLPERAAPPTFPRDLSEPPTEEIVAIYTAFTSLSAHSGYSASLIEAKIVVAKNELHTEYAVRWLRSTEEKTTEKRYKVDALRVVALKRHDIADMESDLSVVKALCEGYRAKVFALQKELDRRTRIRHEQ